MSRQRRSSEIQFGSDSFLDVVANIVGILIILKDRDKNARQRKAGAVERVHKFRLIGIFSFETDIGAPRLKIREGAGTRYFEPAANARRQRFQDAGQGIPGVTIRKRESGTQCP